MKNLLTISSLLCLLFGVSYAQPAPPQNARSEGSLRSIKVSWDKSSTVTVTKYSIYRSASFLLPTYYKLADVTATQNASYSYVDYTLVSGIWYYYYIVAYASGVNSQASNTTKNRLTAQGKSIVIISQPITQVRTGNQFGYHYYVQAVSPDTGGTVQYSLLSKPDGMTINEYGEVAWQNPVEGNYIIGIRASQSFRNRTAATQFFKLRVVPGTGTVTGLVQNQNGVNVAWARVILFNVNDPENIYDVPTANNGVYYFTDVTAGTYYIVAEAIKQGYGYRWYPNAAHFVNATPIVVQDGQTKTADFLNSLPSLNDLKTVSGIVKDQNGNLLSNATVAAYIADKYYPIGKDSLRSPYSVTLNTEDIISPDATTTSDANGEFSFSLPLGKAYYLFTRKTGFRTTFRGNVNGPLEAKPIVVTANPDPSTIFMKPLNQGSKVSGTLIDAGTQQPLTKTPVVIVQRGGGHVMFLAVTSDSVGKYRFDDIPDGWYSIIALPTGDYVPSYYRANGVSHFWQQSDSINISNANIEEVDVSVPATRKIGLASIAGQVSETVTNTPIQALTVFAFNATDTVNAVAYAVTDSLGNYKVDGLLPGTYILKTDKGGYNTSESSQISVNYTGNSSITNISIEVSLNGIANIPTLLPTEYRLDQNFPNPFNPATTIRYAIPEQTKVTLKVYSILGKEIQSIDQGEKEAGEYSLRFDGSNLPSGIYHYRLLTESKTLMRTMVIIK